MNEVKLGALSNREDYIESFEAIDENDDAIDLTGATIVYEIADPRGGSAVLSATTGNGDIVITTTSFTVTFLVGRVSDLEPKDYNVGCTILLNGVTTQFFVGTLPVVDGVVS